MAIDPTISLGVRPPAIQPLQIQSPLDQFAKVLSLRNLMTENQSGQLGLQTQQLALQERQRGIKDDEDLRQEYAKGNPTDAEIIAKIGPARAIPLIKARAEQTQQFYKTEGERYGLLGQLAGTATDKASAVTAVGRAIRSRAFDTDPAKNAEIGQQMLDHLNTNGFNPDEFKQYQFEAMKAKEAHDAMAADAEAKLKEPGVKAETLTKTADAELKQRQMEASTLAPALARGAVAYEQALANLKPERRALYAGFRTPLEVLSFASTPHEQIMAQQAADTAAETKAQHAQQLWNDPGGLIAIMNDPNSTAADKARAAKGLQQHEGLKRAGASTTVITPNQTISNEGKLRDDYYRDTKDYVSIRNAYNKIIGAAKSGSAAGDIGLVYGFMRMQDPTSTVREGEFATAQNAGGIPERIRAMYNKAVNGERLDPVVRKDFVTQAEKIHGQSYADYLKTKEMYSGIATRGGMDPRNVVIDYSTAKPGGGGGAPKVKVWNEKTSSFE